MQTTATHSSPGEIERLSRDGFTMLAGVFSLDEVAELAGLVGEALQADEPSVLRSQGHTYGSRDLVSLCPAVAELPRKPVLRELIREILGDEAGLVRALFFDKPPERSWSLPWHRDKTIAVKRNDLPSSEFRRPTTKAGIPHVEAPSWLLAEMLTLRVHLDAMTPENGPLSVVPGSHQSESDDTANAVEIHAAAGDVLAMRPLLSHSSSLPHEGTTQHRRIVHLELAARANLPDGFEWNLFMRVN